MSKSDYLEDKIINHVLRNTAYTSPTTVYAALYTAAPSDTGGGAEVTTVGTAYVRQAVTFAAPSPAGKTQNSVEVAFPVATANYGTVTHFGVFDASSAGNFLYWAALDASKVVNTNDQAKFAIGALQIDED